MKKIAILYICTGKYIVFWKEFFLSFENFFLVNYQKEYFVFTDSDEVYENENCERIHVLYQKQLGWPKDTLMRYHIFEKIENELLNFDYVFFMNSNITCQTHISEEILPICENLIAVRHPGFYDKDKYSFPYERNRKSEAYIPFGKGEFYICGGVNGGKSKEYIQMIKTLKQKIEMDLEKNILAVWHDESHINKYMLERLDVKFLEPSYCFPEGWEIPFVSKLVLQDKSRYFNVKLVKGLQIKNKFLYQMRKCQGILCRKMKK